MTHDDLPVWLIWRWQHPGRHDYYHYNVRVGSPIVPPENDPENYRKMAIYNSLLRIDAIGITSEVWTIYEVKQTAEVQTTWQVDVYRSLLRIELPPETKIGAVIVCERADITTKTNAQELGIQVYEIGE